MCKYRKKTRVHIGVSIHSFRHLLGILECTPMDKGGPLCYYLVLDLRGCWCGKSSLKKLSFSSLGSQLNNHTPQPCRQFCCEQGPLVLFHPFTSDTTLIPRLLLPPPLYIHFLLGLIYVFGQVCILEKHVAMFSVLVIFTGDVLL